MAEKSYLISTIKSVRGDPEFIAGLLDGSSTNVDLREIPIDKLKPYAFYSSTLKSISLPDSVIKIPEYCFYSNSALEDINLENIKFIEKNALDGCKYIKNINLNNCEVISSYGMIYCGQNGITEGIDLSDSKLVDIENDSISYVPIIKLPDSLHYLGPYNYYSTSTNNYDILDDIFVYKPTKSYSYGWITYCKNKTGSIIIPEGVYGIADEVFNYSQNMTQLKIPSSLEITCSGTFSGYNTRNSLIIELPSLEKWFDIDFGGSFHYMNSVNNGSDVYTAKQNAYPSCTPLYYTKTCSFLIDGETIDPSTIKKITIPTHGGLYSLAPFSGLEEIEETIPDNFFPEGLLNRLEQREKCYSFHGGYFGNCSYTPQSDSTLYYRLSNSSVSPTNFSGSGGLKYGWDNVTFSSANSYCYIPVSLKKITVNSNNNLPYGYFSYFKTSSSGDKPLEVVLNGNMKKLSTNLFSNSFITNVTINSNIEEIGQKCFYKSKLVSINLPETVKKIDNDAFYECTGLIEITIPNSVTSIGSHAFYKCTGLTSVTIGNGVKSIGTEAFLSCTNLTSVTIGKGVESIGDSAFAYCRGLTSITIPFVGATKNGTSNTHFGYIFGAGSIFNQNAVPASLKEVIITDATIIPRSAFYNCENIERITLPNGLMSIQNTTFSGCKSLTNINIPQGVKTIGSEAFYNCNLTNITIPDSVTSIDSYIFGNCSSLTDINYTGSITQWNSIDKSDVWNGNSSITTIHCTDGDITL